ncbi:adenosylcobinamide-GDP ribazoletransferase [Spirochaetota bacterium]
MNIINIVSSFFISVSILTRIPVPLSGAVVFNEKNAASSTIFFPLVGLFFGFCIFTLHVLLNACGVPAAFQAVCIAALPYIINKFLHFDGLCDTIDAFLADRLPKERLAILKDTKIGSFAVGSAVLIILAKYICIKMLISSPALAQYLVIVPVFARYSMVLLSYRTVYPRETGAAVNIIGKVTKADLLVSTYIVSLIVAFFITVNVNRIFVLFAVIVSCITMFIVVYGMKFISYIKIGGVTGDVLGAMNEIMEPVLFVMILFLFKLYIV